jgi:hypothetical protein
MFDDHVERDGYWFLGGRYHTIVTHENQVNLKSATDLDVLRSAAGLN